MDMSSPRKFHSGITKSIDFQTSEIEKKSKAAIKNLLKNAEKSVANAGVVRKINLLLKRVFDVILSSIALMILFPFFIIVCFLIKRETPGPAIFSQERWGIDQCKIRIYKFRSMYIDKGDVSGVAQTVSDDPRITQIGKILRKTSIDELPQLFNVLKGDMSLVGPRCHAIGMFAANMLYEDLVPQYHTRHLMKPGITGLAQIKGLRGDTSEREPAIQRVENDLRYIVNFSFASDIKILCQTIVREFSGGTGY